MKRNKKYLVTKKIKIHTSPLIEVEVVKQGRFLKETSKYYIFDSFRVQKQVVVKIEETEGN